MSSSASRRMFTALLLTYVFVVSLFSPLAGPARPFRRVKSSSSAPAQATVAHREGELLVRFRAGVSSREKETIIATQGARKKKDLRGQSGIENSNCRVGAMPVLRRCNS